VRGRLFDEEILLVDLGWYLEIEYKKTPQFNDATLEFEMRIPMQKDIGPVSVMFNPIFEKPVTGSENTWASSSATPEASTTAGCAS
jgi:hypothetical protein